MIHVRRLEGKGLTWPRESDQVNLVRCYTKFDTLDYHHSLKAY